MRELFPSNGSYVLAFHQGRHAQDLTELCSKYDEEPAEKGHYYDDADDLSLTSVDPEPVEEGRVLRGC